MAESELPSAAPPPSTGAVRLGYQPALDGMRAFAVAMVVLFHYPWNHTLFQLNPVHGGFLGVDVFFVLSGFLITTLLVQEHLAHGVVSLRRFYARRALRLLPAFGVLWVIAVVLHLVLSVHDGDRPRTDGLLGTLFYVGNWVSIAKPEALGILGPMWSLAIEEQFYLVWPLTLVALFAAGLRLRTIAWLTGIAAVAASLYRIHFWHSHLGPSNFLTFYLHLSNRKLTAAPPATFAHRLNVWNRVYFGSDTRADALLAGCFTAIVLVLVLPRLGARARVVLSFASIPAIVVVAMIFSRAVTAVSGWLVVWGFPLLEVSIAVLIASLVVAPRGVIARVLGFAPFAWIGRRSYAIYLFHLVVLKYCGRRYIDLPPAVSFVFQMAVILAAAEVSYRVVEAPMLRRKRRFEPVAVAATS